MVAMTGFVPELSTVNEGMLPLPVAARPMFVLLLVHVYEEFPPLLVVVKFTAVVGLLLHFTWLGG